MEKRRFELAQKQVQALMGLLSLQFIIGVLLTTIINYDPHKHSAVQSIFLVLHIIVAALLFGLALARLITSLKWNFLAIHSLVGLLAIIGALISGGIAAANANDVAVFLMALGLLVAFSAYGNSIGAIPRQIGASRK